MIDLLSKFQFKNDRGLLVLQAFLALITFAAIWHHDITAKEGFAFLGGVLVFPSALGKKPVTEEEKKDSQ